MNTNRSRHSRPAFTLTELLIVVTIIAILASLITAAAINALNAGKRTQILFEINQISQSMEDFKNDLGAYPPNGLNPNQLNGAVASDFVRMFKKAFPRHQEDPDLIHSLAGSPGPSNNVDPLAGGMNAAEAVYFWLGGFSSDPKFPISGPGGPSFRVDNSLPGNGEVLEDRNRRYDFDLSRLGPRTSDGVFDGTGNRFITYADPLVNGETRRINLWTYTPAKSERPLAYFDASRHTPVEYHPDLSGGAGLGLFPLTKVREGVSASSGYTLGDLVYANDGKFQVVHSGIDDTWGDWSAMHVLPNQDPDDDGTGVIVYPVGPFIGDNSDNLTNFANGTLADAQE
ncbi:type II secretion system protein [Pirellulales bacterium]|nr:type II secretion system protein [Pirellulales bacterium]